jgi:hypothetical protein
MNAMLAYPRRAMLAAAFLVGPWVPATVRADPAGADANPEPAAGTVPAAGTASTARLAPAGAGSGTGDAGEVPSVDALCKAAVALALVEPERARGFVNRARLAGWLPELRFRMYRRFARTEGLSFGDVGAGTVAPVDISAIDDVRYEWRATWDLSRMVFNPDEVQAHFEALRMADVRRDIQELVIRLYFERRRLMTESRADGNAAAGVAATVGRLVRTAEIEAELDALSDGAFSAAAHSRRQAASVP